MALLPAHYLDAVGVLEEAHTEGDEQKFSAVATGTLLGYESPDQSEAGENETTRIIFLVTNRHVIEGKTELWIRFNQGAGSGRFRIGVKDEQGNDMFIVNDQFDVAVSGLDARGLQDAGAEFTPLPEHAFLDMDGFESEGVVEGDPVFVLGFPMGIAGTQKKYAIVRGGVIARVDREIVKETGGFLIDCPVFPGNSGGPVILRPAGVSLVGTSDRSNTHVIGIVSSYVPFIDTAISQQTGRPRVTFEENSGLTNVIPLDVVNELVKPLIEELRAQHQNSPQSEGAAKAQNSSSDETASSG